MVYSKKKSTPANKGMERARDLYILLGGKRDGEAPLHNPSFLEGPTVRFTTEQANAFLLYVTG